MRYSYYQAHLPVRQQDEAFGHAVRAVYLYSGMADIARITKDEELYQACVRLWNNVTKKKMYIWEKPFLFRMIFRMIRHTQRPVHRSD